MNEGVFYNIFPIILMHLPPRDRARCRQVCKRMCALISGSKLWGRSYAEFCKMIAHWKPEHKKLYAQGTWTLKMLNQIQRLIYIPMIETRNSMQTLRDIDKKIQIGEDSVEQFRHIVRRASLKNTNNWDYVRNLLEREGFFIICGWHPKHTLSDESIWKLYRTNGITLMTGLVEGLFTLSDFLPDIPIYCYQVFLGSALGLQILRAGFTLKYVSEFWFDTDIRRMYNVFNNEKNFNDIMCKGASIKDFVGVPK